MKNDRLGVVFLVAGRRQQFVDEVLLQHQHRPADHGTLGDEPVDQCLGNMVGQVADDGHRLALEQAGQVDLQDALFQDARFVAESLAQSLGQERIDLHQGKPAGRNFFQQQPAQDPGAGADLQHRTRLRQELLDYFGGDIFVMQEILAEFRGSGHGRIISQ